MAAGMVRERMEAICTTLNNIAVELAWAGEQFKKESVQIESVVADLQCLAVVLPRDKDKTKESENRRSVVRRQEAHPI